MSNNKENVKEEKIVTKYDQKKKRREELKKQDKRDRKITQITGIAVLVALVALVASFPIRSYLTLNKTFVTIGEEDLKQVEFDYSFYTVMNNYVNTYGDYLSYFGLDLTKDLAEQPYDESLSWKDYFQEMTVNSLVRSKALKKAALAAGYTYDTTTDYEEFVENAKEAAKAQGVSLTQFIKATYGELATLKRIEPYVKEALFVSAYYDKVREDTLPTKEEIQAAYDANPSDYDSVDYRMEEIEAKLPEVVATEEEGGEETDTTPYEPTEEEVASAMAEAKAEADERAKTIAADGTLKENQIYANTIYQIRDWLFDDGRVSGDTTVIENTNSNKYYVVAFEKRYLDESPSVDTRMMVTDQDGQALLDEWKNTGATEESFAKLCDEYSLDTSSKGGLVEGNTKSGINDSLAEWMFAPERKSGDTTVIPANDTMSYVVYYKNQGRPEWQLNIENTLSNETMSNYVEEISANVEVVDKDNNLPYLKIREAQAAAAEETTEE